MGCGLEEFAQLIREVFQEERRNHPDGADDNEQDPEGGGTEDAQDNPFRYPLAAGQGG